MSDAARDAELEALLSDALQPIEPPESLGQRVESTLSRVAEAAASELSSWADEMSESETEALHDPRNWVRPVIATAAGGAAGAALIVLGARQRRRRSRGNLIDELRSRLG